MSTAKNIGQITLTAQEFIDAWKGGYSGVKEINGKGYWADKWGNIVFKNVNVSENIYIPNPVELRYLTIIDSKLKGIRIDHSKIGGFTFENTNVGNFEFYTVTTERIQIRKQSTLNKVFINNNSSITEKFTIEDEAKIFEIKLESKELRKIEIKNSYIQHFIWKQDSFCNLTIDDCKLETLSFKQAIIPKDSVFQISNTFINNLQCTQLVNTGWLNISGLKPLKTYKKFTLDQSGLAKIENDDYKFEELTNQAATLHFENSDLGKTSFVNCDLPAFNKFVFYNTKMLEIFVAGTQLPQSHEIFFLPPIDDNSSEIQKKKYENEKPSQQRLAYSQFKKISENRGDNVQASEFLALEMDAYAEQIANQEGKGGERFNLCLNKFSNNWGNDWVQAVIVTLGINSICFLLYCLSLGYTLGNDCDLFWELTSYCFEFLNPLRKAEFLLEKEEITPLARFIDYFSRIIVAYFTYQTIQAFRRFGKKS